MKQQSDHCKISRWELLKRNLNNLSPAAFRDRMTAGEVVVVDCRRESEFTSGHLPGAINVDYLSYELLDQIEQLDPSRTYLVYCQTGRRSIRTCTLLQNSGFTQVFNLDGGLAAWQARLDQSELEKTD